MISSVSSLNPASGLAPQRKIAEPEAPPDVETVAPDPQSIVQGCVKDDDSQSAGRGGGQEYCSG